MADNMNFGTMGAAPAAAPSRMRSGGFWRRFLAYFIDALVIGLAFIPLNIVGVVLQRAAAEQNNMALFGATALFTIVIGVLRLVVAFFYFGYFLSKKGSTPGKMAMGLKVVDNDNGTNLSFLMGGLRCTIGYMISGIILGIGFFMAGFRSDKKALHDMIFNSHVWYKES